ncbi:MAG TPA: DNA gyrase subunit A [Myxococcota bacterium]|nr:DNA gyrase subunit A [Myxococcota bacterium]
MADEPIDSDETPEEPQGGDGGDSGGSAGHLLQPVNIEDEVRRSFLDYSMSVIVSRALPDVRDGLKPVHRRILYAMQQEGLVSTRAYSKCAGVVGEVLKHYHPHGDGAVYDALVRLVQDFSLRYPLIDGQGNFGSIDGDNAAAYRYTESRLHPLAELMLRDIDRDTVDFGPNFDGSTQEPLVLPTSFPNFLANGSTGIAVGMATNVPPHNLRELVDALELVARRPDCTLDELLEKMPGPDFPTGALICGTDGIRAAYATGRGHITVRARAASEETKRGERIVVTEIPYMVNKATLLERIAELHRDGKVDGIADLRDESNRQGIRIVIELRRDAPADVILNQLFKLTPLQTTFGVNMLALVSGRPQLLSLKDSLRFFLDFRREAVARRAHYDLAQAEARAHILEGFEIALDHIDAIIALIRAADDTSQARAQLQERFSLSERQAQAILDMRLRALTGLERQRVLDELAELRAKIEDLKALLASDARILDAVVQELRDVRERFGDERRTEISAAVESFTTEDLIVEEDMVVTMSHHGYVKRNPVGQYRAQRRGGKGITGMDTKQEDFVAHLFVASTHAHLLFFTNKGRVHWLKVHELPQLGRTARGRAITNLLQLQEGERVQALLPVRRFDEGDYVLLCTQSGVVKKTDLDAYANPRRGGIIAINLEPGDELIAARRTGGRHEVLIATRDGMSIRFPETDVRPMGRTATGVRGIRLSEGDLVVGMEILSPGATVLTVTANGYGKRTPLEDYRKQTRGGSGVITIRTSERNGPVIGVSQVLEADEVMLITNTGRVLRCRVSGISTMGRVTQGVRLMEMNDTEERLVAMARLAEDDDSSGGNPAAPPAGPVAPPDDGGASPDGDE